MTRSTIGIWAESFSSADPAVARNARGICRHLSSSDTVEYLALSDISYYSGMVGFETYPLEPLLGAVLRGADRAAMRRQGLYPDIRPAASIDALLSFDCRERIWDWPLRVLGVRSACVVHDLASFHVGEAPQRDRQTPFFAQLARVADTADVVLGNSRVTADDLRALLPGARTAIRAAYPGHDDPAEHGVDAAAQRGKSALRLAHTVTLVMVGDGGAASNFAILLAAARRIAKGLAPRRLEIVAIGDVVGTGRRFAEEFQHLLGQAREAATVVFPGVVDSATRLQWYGRADVLVRPALWPGFDATLLEALSAGVPVVASDLPGHRELGGELIGYFDPYDSDDVAEAVMRCLSLSPRRRAAQTARATAWATRFSWRRSAAEYGAILTGLAAGNVPDLVSFPAAADAIALPPGRASTPPPVTEAIVLTIADLVGTGGLTTRLLTALLRERAELNPGGVALIVAVDGPGLAGLGAEHGEALDGAELVGARLEQLLAPWPGMPVRLLPIGELREAGVPQSAALRAMAGLSPHPGGTSASASAIGAALPDAADAFEVVYAADNRVAADLRAAGVGFERAVALLPDLPIAPVCATLDVDHVRRLLAPDDPGDLPQRRAFREVCVHGGLAAALGLQENPRRDGRRAGAVQCAEWLLECCPALEQGFSCVAVTTDPSDCRAIANAVARLDRAGDAPALDGRIISVLRLDERRAAPTPPGVLPLRSPAACQTLLLLADTIIGRITAGSISASDDIYAAAAAGKRIILVAAPADRWLARLLGCEWQASLTDALQRAAAPRPSDPPHVATLSYPPGWSTVLAAVRAHSAGRPLPEADIAPLKRALADPATQLWGVQLQREHLTDGDWDRFAGEVAALSEPPAAPAVAPAVVALHPAPLSRKGWAAALVEAPVAFRERWVRRAVARNIAAADRARDARDWGGAAGCYRGALEANPRQPAIWVQLGHALKEQGDLDGAEEAYHKSLLLDDHTADTYLQLGHVLKLQRRIGEAENAYFQALLRDASCEFARSELTALGYSGDTIQYALAVRFLPKGRISGEPANAAG